MVPYNLVTVKKSVFPHAKKDIKLIFSLGNQKYFGWNNRSNQLHIDEFNPALGFMEEISVTQACDWPTRRPITFKVLAQ